MKNVAMMVICSFIIQYFIMPPVMVNSIANITFTLGNAYLSLFMGLLMGVVEVIMYDMRYNVTSVKYYIALFAASAVCVYLYRYQIGITDKQYLEEMIQHHSMALLTSVRIVKKTENYDVAALSKTILQQQTDEINKMRDILSKLDHANK
jgi:hypothetical protein